MDDDVVREGLFFDDMDPSGSPGSPDALHAERSAGPLAPSKAKEDVGSSRSHHAVQSKAKNATQLSASRSNVQLPRADLERRQQASPGTHRRRRDYDDAASETVHDFMVQRIESKERLFGRLRELRAASPPSRQPVQSEELTGKMPQAGNLQGRRRSLTSLRHEYGELFGEDASRERDQDGSSTPDSAASLLSAANYDDTQHNTRAQVIDLTVRKPALLFSPRRTSGDKTTTARRPLKPPTETTKQPSTLVLENLAARIDRYQHERRALSARPKQPVDIGAWKKRMDRFRDDDDASLQSFEWSPREVARIRKHLAYHHKCDKELQDTPSTPSTADSSVNTMELYEEECESRMNLLMTLASERLAQKKSETEKLRRRNKCSEDQKGILQTALDEACERLKIEKRRKKQADKKIQQLVEHSKEMTDVLNELLNHASHVHFESKKITKNFLDFVEKAEDLKTRDVKAETAAWFEMKKIEDLISQLPDKRDVPPQGDSASEELRLLKQQLTLSEQACAELNDQIDALKKSLEDALALKVKPKKTCLQALSANEMHRLARVCLNGFPVKLHTKLFDKQVRAGRWSDLVNEGNLVVNYAEKKATFTGNNPSNTRCWQRKKKVAVHHIDLRDVRLLDISSAKLAEYPLTKGGARLDIGVFGFGFEPCVIEFLSPRDFEAAALIASYASQYASGRALTRIALRGKQLMMRAGGREALMRKMTATIRRVGPSPSSAIAKVAGSALQSAADDSKMRRDHEGGMDQTLAELLLLASPDDADQSNKETKETGTSLSEGDSQLELLNRTWSNSLETKPTWLAPP